MDAELKAKWVAALRSGEYSQHRGSLWGTSKTNLCCIGVGLAVLTDRDVFKCDTDMAANAIGIGTIDQNTLVDMNDGSGDASPVSFAEIADYIEKNL